MSAGSSKYASGRVPDDEKEKGHILGETINQRDIVCALAPIIRIEKREVKGALKEYCVRKCPNGPTKCKNKNAEIVYGYKTGFKNPHSHLATCLFKVSYVERTLNSDLAN